MTTLDYYNERAQEFAAQTADVEFSQMQDRFLALLPAGGRVLDMGCGSGRDAKYFVARGFEVEATDGSPALAAIATQRAGIPVRVELFEELSATEAYDGVWACSSILHAPKAQLPGILGRIATALKPGGVLYTSFKLGDFDGERNGRHFSDFTEDTFRAMAAGVPALAIEQLWITGDVRPGRSAEQWLNLILRKRA